jgi:hypothetical protein
LSTAFLKAAIMVSPDTIRTAIGVIGEYTGPVGGAGAAERPLPACEYIRKENDINDTDDAPSTYCN